MKYKDKKREVGSQSESPSLGLGEDNNGKFANVGGYQIFKLRKDNITFLQKNKKFNLIKEILNDLYDDVSLKTITDIGCSSGLVSFISNNLGYKEVQSFDHDSEYINNIKEICSHLDISKIKASVKQFGDDFEKTDVVLMLALIHWIFSCTSEYGSFDLIFEEVKEKVGDYLLIEWVDPKDGAIKFFNHTSYNKEVIKEEYNVENFEKSILKNFSSIENRIKLDGDYRVLYIIKK